MSNKAEEHIRDIFSQWEEAKKVMEEVILPALSSGGPVSEEDHVVFSVTTQALGATLRLLHNIAERVDFERNPVGAEPPVDNWNEAPEKISAIQECANEWLQEICTEHDIALSVLKDPNTEHFEYSYREISKEDRSWSDCFNIPDRLKAMYEELGIGDFNDDLKEHLDNRIHNDFYPEVDTDDSEILDTTTELT